MGGILSQIQNKPDILVHNADEPTPLRNTGGDTVNNSTGGNTIVLTIEKSSTMSNASGENTIAESSIGNGTVGPTPLSDTVPIEPGENTIVHSGEKSITKSSSSDGNTIGTKTRTIKEYFKQNQEGPTVWNTTNEGGVMTDGLFEAASNVKQIREQVENVRW